MNEDFSNQPQEPVVPEPVKPKNNKRLVFILISAGVILLAAAATIFYLFIVQPKDVAAPTTETSTTSPEVTTDVEEDYAKVIIEKVRTAEQSLVAAHPGLVIKDSENPYSPAYIAEGTEFNVRGEFGYNLIVEGPTATLPTDKLVLDAEKAAIDVLRNENLPTVVANEYGTTYSSENVICHVETNSYPTYISCANTRDYVKLAAEVAPFAAVYFTSSNEAGKDPSRVVLTAPKITKKDTGYNNASVSISAVAGIGGFAGLFYQKDGGVWHYWTGTQSTIPCRNYDKEELQKAFAGDTCYDLAAEKDSVVKVTINP